MLLLATSTLYKYGLNRIFHFAKELDYDGIEINMNEIVDTRDIKYIKELIHRYDMPVLAVAAPHNSNILKVQTAIKVAEAIDADVCSFRPGYWKNWFFNRWIKNTLGKMMEVSKLKISIINPPLGDNLFLPTYAFGDLNSLYTFKNVTLDTAHLVSRGMDLIRVYEFLKKNICHVYLSDASKSVDHLMPGDGILPLESFLTKLKKDKYQNHISIKIRWESIEGYDLEKAMTNLEKIKKFYNEYFVKVPE